jgi:hypothetical protein
LTSGQTARAQTSAGCSPALHTVDLATGAAKAIGAIAGLGGKVTDIAILP